MDGSQADEPAARAVVLEGTSSSGAVSYGAEEPDARATLKWPYKSHEAQERALRRAEAAEESEESPESDGESDSESFHENHRRVPVEEVENDASESEQLSDEAVVGCQDPEQVASVQVPAQTGGPPDSTRARQRATRTSP